MKIKNVNELRNLEKEVFLTMIKEKFDFKYLQNEIDKTLQTGSDLFKNDFNDDYKKVIDILISEKAGIYSEKEFLEKIGFLVNENEYLKNRHEYIDFLLYDLFDYIDLVLKENLNIPAGVHLICNYGEYTGISLILTVEYDYIPSSVKEKLITSVDYDLSISLGEYSSMFDIEGNIKVIKSLYDYDYHKIYFYVINFTDDDDLLEFIQEDIDISVLNYIGSDRSKKELLDRLDYLKGYDKKRFYNKCLHLISSILDYYNLDIQLQNSNNLIELCNQAGLI